MKTVLKMKVFQRVQINLASLGFRPKQSAFNKTQLRIFTKVFLTKFSICAYIVYEANTTQEYMHSMYMIICTVLITVSRVSTLFKNAVIFDFIDKVEKTLNGSEPNIYII